MGVGGPVAAAGYPHAQGHQNHEAGGYRGDVQQEFGQGVHQHGDQGHQRGEGNARAERLASAHDHA